MRFIGGKTLLLDHIKRVLQENTDGTERVFCDIFPAQGRSPAILSRTMRLFPTICSIFLTPFRRRPLKITAFLKFKKLKELGILDPFSFLEETKISNPEAVPEQFFITQNYSPNEHCSRMYLSPQNAKRIDFIRNTIESWKNGRAAERKRILLPFGGTDRRRALCL